MRYLFLLLSVGCIFPFQPYTPTFKIQHTFSKQSKQYFGSKRLSNQTLEVIFQNRKQTFKGVDFKGKFLLDGDVLIDYPKEDGVVILGNTWNKNHLNQISIPYKIGRNLKTIKNTNQQFKAQDVLTAMQWWSNALPIVFVEKDDNNRFHDDYIEFRLSTAEDGTYTEMIGKKGDQQLVKLQLDEPIGNIAHEIGHILGLFHEHSRSDRDKYVYVSQYCRDEMNYNKAEKITNKYKKTYLTINAFQDIGAYDYYSIMHYQENECLVSLNTDLPKGVPGQRDSISSGDIEAVKALYGL